MHTYIRCAPVRILTTIKTINYKKQCQVSDECMYFASFDNEYSFLNVSMHTYTDVQLEHKFVGN